MEQSLHESMRKSDFGAVHGAIAHALDEGEVFRIAGIEDGLVHNVLYEASAQQARQPQWIRAITLIVSITVHEPTENVLGLRGSARSARSTAS